MKAYDPTTDFDPSKIYQQYIAAGHEWVDKNAAYQLLKEVKDTLRSTIEARHLDADMSVAKAQTLAKADSMYIDHVKAMVEAQKAADWARVNYDGAKVLADMRRSQISFMKAQAEIL